MPLLHRFVAALSSLLLLQFLALGSGTLCAIQHSMTRASTAHSMHHMSAAGRSDMSVMASMTVTTAAEAPVNPADCNGSGQHDGCGLPFAPGQCSSMTTCAISAMPAVMDVSSADVGTVVLELSSPTLEHSGPTFAPELPPPRA